MPVGCAIRRDRYTSVQDTVLSELKTTETSLESVNTAR